MAERFHFCGPSQCPYIEVEHTEGCLLTGVPVKLSQKLKPDQVESLKKYIAMINATNFFVPRERVELSWCCHH